MGFQNPGKTNRSSAAPDLKSNADSDWYDVGGNGFAPLDADLDRDGSVTVFDYGYLSDNFDKNGDDI